MEAMAVAARHPTSSAPSLVAHAAELGRGLLAFAEMSDDDVAEVERVDADVLFASPHGELWVCARPHPGLNDGRPWATARALRDLGRAFALAVADTLVSPDRATPEQDDAVANDFGDK